MKKTINKKADLQSLVDVFKALGDSSRLKIFNILISANSNLCVGMIAHNLSMTQPAVSQHLKNIEKFPAWLHPAGMVFMFIIR